MSLLEPVGEPTKRQWLGFWSMIVQQTQNAFNDKAAQFILIPLAGAVAYEIHIGKSITLSAESAAGLMIAMPFVLFAPLAGWMSDRFSKRNVILGAAIAQVAILTLICVAVLTHRMPLALLGFFLLAVQSAFFSPAKIGINKELVGSKHLGFASGVQQMTAMLAILAGQIVSGWWFDHRFEEDGAMAGMAWDAAYTPLVILALCSIPSVLMAVTIPKVSSHGREKLSGKLLISHFKDIGELWKDRGLRRASFGVAYFWGFAAFINLWSVKVAKSMTDGGRGFGTLSSDFMTAVGAGMVLGFGSASWLLRKRIELGWVPLAGLLMTVSALVLAFLHPGGWAFLFCLGFLAFSAALFLAPLNAWMQDRYPRERRGELQSAVNLQDCFAGIISVSLIGGMIQLAKLLGMTELAGFRMQMVVIGLSCGVMTWFVLRILPADFIRLICLAGVKFIYRIKLTGTGRIPKEGGALLLPNHVTFADAFFLSAASDRPLRFVMDDTFMANRAIRFAMNLFDGVAIRRDQPLEAIRKTIDALEGGHLVVLFPEGQLTRTGGLCEIERGFELIARKARASIIPIWVDGSWGSIFSFERGRFFRKMPYRVPFGLAIAVGEEITSSKPTCAEVQAALMKASSDAVALRFSKGAPPARLNAHRMTQLDAIPRGVHIHLLEGELDPALVSSLGEFARIAKGRLVMHDGFAPLLGEHWVGGDMLRAQIVSTLALEKGISFHDFGSQAPLLLERENLTHLPCHAAGGDVISMSMPHPARPLPTSTFQSGYKAGSWGKILPGWHLAEGRVFPGDLPLPEGATLDAEGFIVKA